jgi:hypothetical protein
MRAGVLVPGSVLGDLVLGHLVLAELVLAECPAPISLSDSHPVSW